MGQEYGSSSKGEFRAVVSSNRQSGVSFYKLRLEFSGAGAAAFGEFKVGQFAELLERDEKERERLASQVFESIEEAAVYAGVDVETVEQWIDDGLVTLEDGTIPKKNLQSEPNKT